MDGLLFCSLVIPCCLHLCGCCFLIDSHLGKSSLFAAFLIYLLFRHVLSHRQFLASCTFAQVTYCCAISRQLVFRFTSSQVILSKFSSASRAWVSVDLYHWFVFCLFCSTCPVERVVLAYSFLIRYCKTEGFLWVFFWFGTQFLLYHLVVHFFICRCP